MRYLATLFLIGFSFSIASAIGGNGCGAILPASHHLNTTDAERSGVFLPDVSRGGVRNVPVVYHCISRTNGTQGVSLQTIFETHCELNIDYTHAQINFYIYAIDTIKDDALWAMSDGMGGTDFGLGYSAFSTYNEDNVVNVYVSGGLPGLCGFATYPGSAPNGGGMFLNAACCGTGGKTIAHEMGHFFNLPHTFEQTNPREYVDGSNCSNKGDRFCDTPADFLDERTPCPYNGPETDAHGDLYRTVIDETLIMSYFNDVCVNRFSNQQEAEMNSTLSVDRDELLTLPTPDLTPLDSVEFVTPINGDSTAIASGIVFKWHPVARAQYYYFRLQPATSSLVLVDTIIKDTTFIAGGLQANKSYRFYVRPISYGNVCQSAAPFKYFQTSVIKATFTAVAPSCPGQGDGAITVTPSNGMFPYTVNWSNSQTGNTVTGLAPGTYTVTITDNNGKVAIATVQITDPQPLVGGINKVGVNLNASATGGTAPYVYSWSNGVNSQYNNNVTFGTYTVTITDARGCTATQTFTYSSVSENIETPASIKVYPNPANRASNLSLQITLQSRTEATIELINSTGQIMQQVKKEFEDGPNHLLLNIAHIPAGVYLVRFTANSLSTTQRVTILR